MADINTVLSEVCAGMTNTVGECGMEIVYPQGKGTPVVEGTDGSSYVEFAGEGKKAKVEYVNDKIALYGAMKEGEVLPSDYSRLTLTLLESETANAKDIRYVVNDFSDTLVEFFGTKTVKPVKTKLPTPVSKAQAKSGMLSYDPNTLASRFTAIYPELREAYRMNCEKYGMFLPEDFFINYGTPAAVATIRENDSVKMKKLFNLLNDIYEDGTNETQGIICVTILGALENDQELLANCVDYMSDDLAPAVINVNRYLYSKDGKGARIRLENPPKYKPKKKVKNPFTPTNGLG
ncbi:MAG: hypothetical protein K6B52_06960 [Clostridiales bacterium]|nr:hypothetical protein [Clostridiales bacterium]